MSITTVRRLLQIKGGDVWSITPQATVFEALRLMADKDVGALLVMVDDKLVGIISERDYARKVILQGKASKDTLVKDIMTSVLFTIHPDQTIEECMELMTNRRIRHVPVVLDDQILGVISIGDVVKDIIYQQRQTIKSLEKYVTG
jgi:CBS domain-containing protein